MYVNQLNKAVIQLFFCLFIYRQGNNWRVWFAHLNLILNSVSARKSDCNVPYLINAWGNRRCSNKNNKRSKLCSSQDLQCLGEKKSDTLEEISNNQCKVSLVTQAKDTNSWSTNAGFVLTGVKTLVIQTPNFFCYFIFLVVKTCIYP